MENTWKTQTTHNFTIQRTAHNTPLEPKRTQIPFYRFPKTIFSTCRDPEPPNQVKSFLSLQISFAQSP